MDIIKYAIENGCSDIHITENKNAFVRIRGEIVPTEFHVNISMFINSLELNKGEFEGDFSFDYGDDGIRIRGNMYHSLEGINIALRVLGNDIPSISKLRLPPLVETFAKCSNGLVLVTGTTGSGKSTTLAAIIDLINSTRNVNIITIEKPIEYVYHPKRARISQREVGVHTNSFAEAAVSAMREDPDVILLGEIRDYNEIENAITLAETGHLVFATLHSKGVTTTADRLAASYPPQSQDQARVQIASVLRGVIHQTLVPDTHNSRLPLVEIITMDNVISNAILKKEVNFRDHIRSSPQCIHLSDNTAWHISNGDLTLEALDNILTPDDYHLVKTMMFGKRSEFSSGFSKPNY